MERWPYSSDESPFKQQPLSLKGLCHLLLTAVFFQEGVFQGLIPILNCYLENMEVDVDTRCTILNYLKLIKKRASGKILLKGDV